MLIRLKNRRESKWRKSSVKTGYVEMLINSRKKNPGRIIKIQVISINVKKERRDICQETIQLKGK